jgi:hypothetical protein
MAVLYFIPYIFSDPYFFLPFQFVISLQPFKIGHVFMYIFSITKPATLTEGFPFFFLSCKANARVYLAKTGHGPYSS